MRLINFLLVLVGFLILIGFSDNKASAQSNSVEANSTKYGNTTEIYKAKAYEQAIAFYDKALSLKPNTINILINKGLVLNELGRYQEAIGVFDKILSIDPRNVDALYSKAVGLAKLGKIDEARAYHSIVNNIAPDYKPKLLNRVSQSTDIAMSKPSIARQLVSNATENKR